MLSENTLAAKVLVLYYLEKSNEGSQEALGNMNFRSIGRKGLISMHSCSCCLLSVQCFDPDGSDCTVKERSEAAPRCLLKGPIDQYSEC